MANGSLDAHRSLTQSNPVPDSEIDWNRHLPPGVRLSRVEHDRCAITSSSHHCPALFNNALSHGVDSWASCSGTSRHGDFELSPNCSIAICIAPCRYQPPILPSKRRTIRRCYTTPYWPSPPRSQTIQPSRTPLPAINSLIRPSRASRANANSQS